MLSNASLFLRRLDGAPRLNSEGAMADEFIPLDETANIEVLI